MTVFVKPGKVKQSPEPVPDFGFRGKIHVGKVSFSSIENLCRYMVGRLNGTHPPYVREQCVSGVRRAVMGSDPRFKVSGWALFEDEAREQTVEVVVELAK